MCNFRSSFNSKQAVIVGAGWLGKALADQLEKQHWQVEKTSRQTPVDTGWVQFNLKENISTIGLSNAVWFFCIPPGRTNQAQLSYAAYLHNSLKISKSLNSSQFVFCSTTGVYPSLAGIYNESFPIDGKTEKQSRLLGHEAYVLQNHPCASIVRY